MPKPSGENTAGPGPGITYDITVYAAPYRCKITIFLSCQVFVMGQGDMGQLGLGEELMERKKPHPVGGALECVRVVQVVCGGMHTVALSEDGKVRG